jgi:hypothetical protein
MSKYYELQDKLERDYQERLQEQREDDREREALECAEQDEDEEREQIVLADPIEAAISGWLMAQTIARRAA